MRVAQWLWGTGFLTAGAVVAAGLLPGDVATGPRLGLAMAFLTMGCLILGIPLSTWLLRRTTRPEDYKGTCPVGWSCPPCGAFNYHPRTECRSCGAGRPAGA